VELLLLNDQAENIAIFIDDVFLPQLAFVFVLYLKQLNIECQRKKMVAGIRNKPYGFLKRIMK
jgi:hypothetical protein